MLGGTSTETDNNKTVVLKVDERKLGEVVVNILNSNYGMRIAR